MLPEQQHTNSALENTLRKSPNMSIYLNFILFSIYLTLTIKIEYNLVYLYITIAKHKMSAN